MGKKQVVSVGLTLLAGVGIWFATGAVVKRAYAEPFAKWEEPTPTGRIRPAILQGRFENAAMPPGRLAVLHVWQPACEGCEPAFDAMKQIAAEGGLDLPVPTYNIAVVQGDAIQWAREHGVHTNLVNDPGGYSVYKPLGLTGFTTLVVDKDGTVLLRDRPDRPGFRERVRAAVHADGSKVAPLDADTVHRRAYELQSGLAAKCFDVDQQFAFASITATIDGEGRVTEAHVGTYDPETPFARCVANEVSGWRFPSSGGKSRDDTLAHFALGFRLP